MNKLILATVSALALGIAGAGIGHAQTTNPEAASPGAQAWQGKQSENWSPSQVKEVQQRLKAAGAYNGPIDGRMGTQTQQAIAQFQKKHGLRQTGTLDRQTMAALNINMNETTGGAGSSTQSGTPSTSTNFTGVRNPLAQKHPANGLTVPHGQSR
ncbi:MAG TPA: peptidoglycan-binding domain-containing protein [Stellaceae bacterium]|nr:peptidoglycan-binding domain-containing protein [Stellaceae bacterium]